MIAEALDVAQTLVLALLVWIGRAVYRFAGARRAPGVRLRPEVPESVPRALRPADRRQTPRWALPIDVGPEAEKPPEAA